MPSWDADGGGAHKELRPFRDKAIDELTAALGDALAEERRLTAALQSARAEAIEEAAKSAESFYDNKRKILDSGEMLIVHITRKIRALLSTPPSRTEAKEKP
jgi:signal transduction protein with GAF and PtsI domain